MEYKYSAFISYKHVDEKYAVWLQKKLENFRLPVKLCDQYKLPKKLKPCFRDVTDLTGGMLEASIMTEMQQCQYMILICSPHMYQNSKYIDFEVEAFRKIHGDAYIIPFIVDGEIGEQAERNPFPSVLKGAEKEFLGINIGQDGKKIAYLKVVAKILGLSADDLIARERARQRKRTAIVASVVAVLTSALLMGWLYVKPYETQYLDYVLVYNEPQGVYPLTDAQKTTETAYYNITTQMGKTIALEYVNAAGVLLDDSSNWVGSRPSKAVYAYQDGMVSTVTYYDKYDDIVYSQQFSVNSIETAFFNDGVDPDSLFRLSSDADQLFDTISDLLSDTPQGNISGYSYTYTADGYIETQMFLRNNEGLSACTDDLIYGLEFVYDAQGRVIEKYFLDALSERKSDENGVYCTTYDYIDGRLATVQYTSKTGALVLGQYNFASLAYTYGTDSARLDFYDAAGQLVNVSLGNRYDISDTYYNAASLVYVYDKAAQTRSASYYDAAGDLVVLVQAEYDALDRCIAQAYFDADGNATTNNNYEKREYTYYENNRIQTIALTPPAEGASEPDNQYLVIEYSYDEDWQETMQSYYDESGNLVVYDGTYAAREIVYQDGKPVRLSYYGSDMQLMFNPYEGCAGYALEYDQTATNPTLFSYFNEDGELDYYRMYVMTVEEQLEMYALLGSDLADLEGIETVLAEWREESLAEAESVRVAMVEFRYSNGEVSQTVYYDKNGEKTLTQGGYCKTTFEKDYRSDSKLEETLTFYDTSDYITTQNISVYYYTGVVETEAIIYYDENKAFAEIITYYDESGSAVKKEYFEYSETNEKILSSTTLYDEYGRDISCTQILEDEAYGQINTILEYTYYDDDCVKTQTYTQETLDGALISCMDKTYYALETPGLTNGYLGTMASMEFTSYSGGVAESYSYYAYNEAGETTGYANITYDETGEKTSESECTYATETEPKIYINRTYHEDGSMTEGILMTYLDETQDVTINMYDADGTLIVSE